jgi:acetyl esterase/lipase
MEARRSQRTTPGDGHHHRVRSAARRGTAYAERLQQAGVPVTAKAYDGVIHGFFWMGGVLEDEMGKELRAHFG